MTVDDRPIPYELVELPNPYPVDSTYHRCCQAIGRHAVDCANRADVADDMRAQVQGLIDAGAIDYCTPAELVIVGAVLGRALSRDRGRR